MPVVFRCFYCRGKLSIARRKAGHDVACPRCQAVITVPVPDDLGNELTELLSVGSHLAAAAAPAPPELPQAPADYDFDAAAAAAFDGGDLVAPPPPVPKPPPKKKPSPMSARSANDLPLFEADEIEQLLASKIGPERLPEPAPAVKAAADVPNMVSDDAVVISRAKATLLMIGAVIGVGLAFAAGYFVRGW